MTLLCSRPWRSANIDYGCGKCDACRISYSRLWTTRILLEAMTHADSIFITLTMDEEHYPEDGSLIPRDTQLFIKRLRKAVAPLRFRYYLIGEYGRRTSRAHYHAVLFGLDRSYEPLIRSTWTKGLSDVGDLTPQSAAYIAGYVVGKDPNFQPHGRHPPFTRMSLRPGIGATAHEEIMRIMYSREGAISIAASGDVPSSIRIAGRVVPLGRYIRRVLRDAYGIDKKTPKPITRALQLSAQITRTPQSEKLTRQTRLQHAKNAATRVRLTNSRRSL